ncbi:MAG: hypothetical protein FWE87_06670, partial [Coriobacteriia bacterium]|nr:hypothetical protein [Coriobacteriia bacterium]
MITRTGNRRTFMLGGGLLLVCVLMVGVVLPSIVSARTLVQELRCLTPGLDGIGGDGWSGKPQINSKGQVVFESDATDLVAGITSGSWNIYLYDNGTLSCLTPGTGGNGANNESFNAQINEAGQVVFCSRATNLLAGITSGESNIYLYDNGVLSCLTPGTGGSG